MLLQRIKIHCFCDYYVGKDLSPYQHGNFDRVGFQPHACHSERREEPYRNVVNTDYRGCYTTVQQDKCGGYFINSTLSSNTVA